MNVFIHKNLRRMVRSCKNGRTKDKETGKKKKVFSKLRDLKTNKMHKFLSYLNTNQN